jgi:hypothetical protein
MATMLARYPPWQISQCPQGLYFYNEESREATWEMPSELQGVVAGLVGGQLGTMPACVTGMQPMGGLVGGQLGAMPACVNGVQPIMPSGPALSGLPLPPTVKHHLGRVGDAIGSHLWPQFWRAEANAQAKFGGLQRAGYGMRWAQSPPTQVVMPPAQVVMPAVEGAYGAYPADVVLEPQYIVRPRSCLGLADFRLTDATWKRVWGFPKDICGCVFFCPVTCISPSLYFFMRLSMLIGWSVVLAQSWRLWSGPLPFSKWWIYLDHQAAFLEGLYFLFATISTGMAAFSWLPDGRGWRTPWFVRISWLLADITPVLALTASAAYWFPIWLGESNVIVDDMAKLLHIVNLALLGVDMAFSRQPLQFAHAWVPFVYTAGYTFFTWIYFKEGGTDWKGRHYIYSFLDWGNKDPKHMQALVVEAMAIIGIPVLYCALLLLLKVVGLTGCAWRDPEIDGRAVPVLDNRIAPWPQDYFDYDIYDSRLDRRLPRGLVDYGIDGVRWDRRQRQVLDYDRQRRLVDYNPSPRIVELDPYDRPVMLA